MPKIPESIQHQIIDRVDTLIAEAIAYTGCQVKTPSISFRRSGGNAGTAHLQRNHVNFNPIFLADNFTEYLNQVIPHEIAHIVVFQCFGKVKPHGKEWQSVMREIYKCDPDVRHSMTLPENAQRGVDYRCDCGIIKLGIRRHNKVLRGEQSYQCRQCRQTLVAV